MKSKVIFSIFAAGIMFFSCGKIQAAGKKDTFTSKYVNDKNPTISKKASVSQDFIFNINSVGVTKITIRRSEWDKMLSYFDYFHKNENSVMAESYEYEKDGKKWKLNQVGMRLRGNTSRFRPQGKDYPKDELGNEKKNAQWSQPYYEYAAKAPENDYRQSHFKIDFEPGDDKRKMSDCMKGVGLKRSDSVFAREIFCYEIFHQFAIWTAPRASQTKVYINIVEDVDSNGQIQEDISTCKSQVIDYGVYEMFEEVSTQSLKGRMKNDDNNKAENAWINNKGDLWKCSEADLSAASYKNKDFGCEEVLILNTDKKKSKWSYVWKSYPYDLKTNKSDVKDATKRFQVFLNELNALSKISENTEQGTQARKEFYEKWFDVDFFIKTYAVNIILGMDDDYWGNRNNYYLYFDNGKDGSGKCYLIPFDYDNSLGNSITDDKTFLNPYNWGNGEDRPLIDRLLEVPEYKEKFTATLLEVSSQDKNNPWNKDNCFKIWNTLHKQVANYVGTKNLTGWPNINSIGLYDDGGWKEKRHYLTRDNDNYYEQVTRNMRFWLSGKDTVVNFDLNGGTMNGNTGVVTGKFDGSNTSIDSMAGKPVRSGYEFIGWTRTKDGSDFAEKYNGETDLTVYASWVKASGVSGLSLVQIKDDSYKGIKVAIVNMPENHYRRTFYINGKEVGGDSMDNPEKYGKIWAYPFTEAGKTYEISVAYSDRSYRFLGKSDTLKVKATSGEGEFKVTNKPVFEIADNKLKWKTEPVIQIGKSKKPVKEDSWTEFYLLEVQSTKPNWNYQSWNFLGGSNGNGFNFKEHVNKEVLSGTQGDLSFRLHYCYNGSPFGDLTLVIVDYGDVEKFNIE